MQAARALTYGGVSYRGVTLLTLFIVVGALGSVWMTRRAAFSRDNASVAFKDAIKTYKAARPLSGVSVFAEYWGVVTRRLFFFARSLNDMPACQ